MKRKLQKKIRLRGFTLTEVLVVIAILGVIVGLLFPAIQYVRESSRRTHCRSNLRQIGIAMDQYLDIRGVQGKYPVAAILPSLTPSKPSLYDVLSSFVEENQFMFQCPSDNEYFAKEGLSYEYPASRLENKTRQQVLKSSRSSQSSSTILISYDFEEFHGAKGVVGSRNYLYMDGHVSGD